MAIGWEGISKTARFGGIVGIIVIVAAIYLPARGALDLDVERNAEDYTTLLINLSFIALVVERFIEIAVTAQRGPGKLKRISELKMLEEAQPVDPQAVKDCEYGLIDYRADTERFALRVGFILGAALALGGVRVLEVLYDTHHLTNYQDVLLVGLDVLLTAGLIAGGSKGINKLTDRMQKMISGDEKLLAAEEKARAAEEKARVAEKKARTKKKKARAKKNP